MCVGLATAWSYDKLYYLTDLYGSVVNLTDDKSTTVVAHALTVFNNIPVIPGYCILKILWSFVLVGA